MQKKKKKIQILNQIHQGSLTNFYLYFKIEGLLFIKKKKKKFFVLKIFQKVKRIIKKETNF
jgi:hypothetical protein